VVVVDSEAWRYTGRFTRFNRFKNSFPGLGIAIVAFAGYCTYEHFFLQDDHHHGSEHGKEHH
jgi:NADH dehydrogenase (ubiquinone) 1 beta subcomplex subunit 3